MAFSAAERVLAVEQHFQHLRITPAAVFGRYECEAGWTWQPRLSDFVLWWVVDGYGAGSINDGAEFAVQPGTLLILRPGDTGDFRQHDRSPLTVLSCHFELTDAATGTPAVISEELLPRRRFDVKDKAAVSDLMTRLVRARNEARLFRTMTAQGLLLELLALCHRLEAEADGVAPELDHRLGEAVRIMRERVSQRLTLGELAALVSLTPAQLSDMFSSQMGVTFRRFALDVRMERAQFLLHGTDRNVGQIAKILGYSDQFLFSRQFRDKFGLSPSRYRDSVHNLGSS